VKFWVKIIIAVCVVVVIGFSVWAFCFREKDEVQAYNRTAELINYKQSLGIHDKLVDLRKTNYINNNPEKVIGTDTDMKQSIHNLRELCFSEVPLTNNGNIQYYSYFVIDEYVDTLIEYYLPYTQSNKSKSKPLKNLKNNIEDYMRSLSNMNETLDELIEYQSLIEGSDTEIEILKSYYDNLNTKYRKCLSRSTDVVLAVVDYIDVCVYSDNLKLDVVFALNDAFVRSLKCATTIETILEPDYSNDVKFIKDVIDKYHDGTQIFSEEYNEYEFLNSYSKLYNDYKDTLNYVYSCKNLEKQQMAEGALLSSIVENAQDSVVVILNVFGF